MGSVWRWQLGKLRLIGHEVSSVKLHTMMYHKPTDMTYFPAHNAAQKVLNFGLGGSQTLTATLIAVSYLCGDIG